MPTFSLDHIVVYVEDLARAAADWRELGLVATDGGSHPLTGTRNTIVRFPDGTFLELLTLEDRAKAKEEAPAIVAFVELHPEGPINWALRTDDLDAARRVVGERGVPSAPVRKGEGRRDSGKVARWRTFATQEAALPFLVEYEGPPTSPPSPEGLPVQGVIAAIVQGVSAEPLARRIAETFGSLREDGRVQLDSGEVAVVEVPDEHPGVIGAELLVTDVGRATDMLAERGVRVVDGWVSDARLHGLSLRLVAE